ncbi:glycine--tRNA ligase subunit beta [Cyanobacterium stanieri LEGE 03274]|uniref:Glycine--tRNA ligase beta subunit n=1 Tax=Cyanobacterium stanieri LEGE 03274 TaxID=1828756 RepID=A0ABR9UZN0_9CHRO|nr:glycine--tRNA ligase subunit beta [Cyanobacterium stanieri]MBE9221075.1 glycine--tRNA ligase subunit beta [Cyanobacterium stanieri LEGE 03274]
MPDFLLEIGTEELPASFVDSAIAQWQEKIKNHLESEYLQPEKINIYGTPRRLAVLIEGIGEKQPDREEEIKGPPVSAAYKDGQPTKALEGFTRKQGVSMDEVEIKSTPKGDFIFVNKKFVGKNSTEILQQLIPQWITGLEGRRFMRWADGDLRFPRPIRHLVALWDNQILPLQLPNGNTTIKAGLTSTGHRILHPEKITIETAKDYKKSLEKAFVQVDVNERCESIKKQIQEIAQKVGGKAEIYPDLLAEVTNLVEYPTAVLGSFEPEFLQLPPEVITTVMVTHQRYFPIKDEKGALLPYFITIGNGDPQKSAIIATGNAKVIRARLADAQFFYQADCDEHLETYLPQLENVTFQEDLGTMHDKVNRIIAISQQIAEQLNLDATQRAEIESTASLCKADLVTQMVYEFPELQGVMGEKYALVSGESATVAKGIFEHYLPRNADDIMPHTLNGQVVGMGDRLDTIVSIIGLGMIPSGSSDPFALRRSANGIINIAWHGNLGINLTQLIEQACNDFLAGHNQESPLPIVTDFFLQRIQTLLQDELNIDYDLVNAVLGEDDQEYKERALNSVLDIRNRALFLQGIRNNGTLANIYETVNRSTKLAKKGTLNTTELDPHNIIKTELFESNSEQELYNSLEKLLPISQKAKANSDYHLLTNALVEIAPTISNFFDGENSVLVMADDDNIKQNRLNLLGLLRNHSRILADFGAIVK